MSQYVLAGLAAFPTPIRSEELGARLDVPMEDLGPVLIELEEDGIITIGDEGQEVALTGQSLGACALCQHEIVDEPYHTLVHQSHDVDPEERYVLHRRCAKVLTFMLES